MRVTIPTTSQRDSDASSVADGGDAILDPYHAAPQVDTLESAQPWWKGVVGWSKWLISAGLIAYVLWRIEDPAQVLRIIGAAQPLYLAAAFLLIFSGLVIGAFRWQLLLSANGISATIPFLLGSGCVASFVRLFLPSTIGGDAVRTYDSWRAGASKSLALATIGVDRLLGLFALVLVACGAMFFNPTIAAIPGAKWIAMLIALAMLTVIFWIFFVGRDAPSPIMRLWRLIPTAVRRPFDKLFAALGSFHGHHDVLVKVFSLGLLLQLNVIAFYWLIALGLGLDISFLQMLAAAPIAIFVMLVPLTINGIGLRETVWAMLLGAYGFEEADGVALGVVEFGLFLAFGLLGGLVYAARK